MTAWFRELWAVTCDVYTGRYWRYEKKRKDEE